MWGRRRNGQAAADDRERQAIAAYRERSVLYRQLCTIVADARRTAEARERLEDTLRRDG